MQIDYNLIRESFYIYERIGNLKNSETPIDINDMKARLDWDGISKLGIENELIGLFSKELEKENLLFKIENILVGKPFIDQIIKKFSEKHLLLIYKILKQKVKIRGDEGWTCDLKRWPNAFLQKEIENLENLIGRCGKGLDKDLAESCIRYLDHFSKQHSTYDLLTRGTFQNFFDSMITFLVSVIDHKGTEEAVKKCRILVDELLSYEIPTLNRKLAYQDIHVSFAVKASKLLKDEEKVRKMRFEGLWWALKVFKEISQKLDKKILESKHYAVSKMFFDEISRTLNPNISRHDVLEMVKNVEENIRVAHPGLIEVLENWRHSNEQPKKYFIRELSEQDPEPEAFSKDDVARLHGLYFMKYYYDLQDTRIWYFNIYPFASVLLKDGKIEPRLLSPLLMYDMIKALQSYAITDLRSRYSLSFSELTHLITGANPNFRIRAKDRVLDMFGNISIFGLSAMILGAKVIVTDMCYTKKVDILTAELNSYNPTNSDEIKERIRKYFQQNFRISNDDTFQIAGPIDTESIFPPMMKTIFRLVTDRVPLNSMQIGEITFSEFKFVPSFWEAREHIINSHLTQGGNSNLRLSQIGVEDIKWLTDDDIFYLTSGKIESKERLTNLSSIELKSILSIDEIDRLLESEKEKIFSSHSDSKDRFYDRLKLDNEIANIWIELASVSNKFPIKNKFFDKILVDPPYGKATIHLGFGPTEAIIIAIITIRESFRLLKKGGKVVMTLPAISKKGWEDFKNVLGGKNWREIILEEATNCGFNLEDIQQASKLKGDKRDIIVLTKP